MFVGFFVCLFVCCLVGWLVWFGNLVCVLVWWVGWLAGVLVGWFVGLLLGFAVFFYFPTPQKHCATKLAPKQPVHSCRGWNHRSELMMEISFCSPFISRRSSSPGQNVAAHTFNHGAWGHCVSNPNAVLP